MLKNIVKAFALVVLAFASAQPTYAESATPLNPIQLALLEAAESKLTPKLGELDGKYQKQRGKFRLYETTSPAGTGKMYIACWDQDQRLIDVKGKIVADMACTSVTGIQAADTFACQIGTGTAQEKLNPATQKFIRTARISSDDGSAFKEATVRPLQLSDNGFLSGREKITLFTPKQSGKGLKKSTTKLDIHEIMPSQWYEAIRTCSAETRWKLYQSGLNVVASLGIKL